jgi:DNA-binding CsgD family transcriptional regulator
MPRLADVAAFVDRSPVATLMFGLPDQRVRAANQALAELIGSTRPQIVGRRPTQVWDGADGRRGQAALSALVAAGLDSYRTRQQLRTSAGSVAVGVWVRQIRVVGGSVAVAIVVPEAEPKVAIRSAEPIPGSEAVDVADDESPVPFVLAEAAGDVSPRSEAERIDALERHLLRFAAELHAGDWRSGRSPAVDASRLLAVERLPRRQREIVDRLLRGERIPAIAASMYISASTVRNHLSHVYGAFGVHSQSELLSLLRSASEAI